jgi:hypothetical protein
MLPSMSQQSLHLSHWIGAPAAEVYAYARDPAHLPAWAPGLGTAVEQVDGEWFVITGGGRVKVTFAPRNEFGVLDHDVTLPSGEVVYNPLRVTPYGAGSEVVFALRRAPGMTDEEFARDAAAVTADLARLAEIVEGRAAAGGASG